MAQIKTGTSTVTNGSSTVIVSADLTGKILTGAAFNVRGEDAVYSIAAEPTEDNGTWILALTAPYAGVSGEKNFQITTSFTPLYGLYEPDINDVDIAILLKFSQRRLDSQIGAAGGGSSHVVANNGDKVRPIVELIDGVKVITGWEIIV